MDAGQMGEPVNPWMMETGSIIFWCVLAGVSVILAIKDRRLSLLALTLIGGTSTFWQEFFGDWGSYLAWNPHFARLPFWGQMAFTTPVKPLFIPFSWGWFYAATIPLLVVVVRWVTGKLPQLSATALSIIVAVPLFAAYDISVEGSATANGWWTYGMMLGPVLKSAKGSIPFIVPVFLGVWAAWVVAMLVKRDADGLWWHERVLGVGRTTPGIGRELARVGAFILMFQITSFVVLTAPSMLFRLAMGGPSTLVP